MKTLPPLRLVALLLAAVTSSAAATTYYVNPNTGVDTAAGGSSGAPWRTLGYAVTRVAANQGHVISLASGVHSISTGVTVPTGVSIAGEGIENTTLTCLTTTTYPLKFQSSTHVNGDQSLQDLTFDGNNRSSARGVYIRFRNNVTVQNVRFQNFGETAMDIVASYDATKTTPPTSYLTGIVIDGCTFINSAKDFATYSNGSLNIGSLDGAVIKNCTFQEDRGYGIKFFNYGWFKGLKVHDCTFDMPETDVLWGVDAAVELWNLYDECEFYNNSGDGWYSLCLGHKGNGFYSFRFYNNAVTQAGNRIQGIEANLDDCEIFYNVFQNCMAGVGMYAVDVSNVLIHHNIVRVDDATNAATSTRGVTTFIAEGTLSDVKIWNNVFDNTERGIELQTADGTPGKIDGTSIYNNIFRDSVLNDGDTAIALWGRSTEITNTVLAYNFIHNVQTSIGYTIRTPAATLIAENNTFADPQLRLTGTNVWNMYAPTVSSAIINAGADVGLAFYGSAPDAGAVEHYLVKTEAELASPVGTGAGVTNMAHTLASNGQRAVLFADSVGDAALFTLQNVPAGKYTVKLRYQQFYQRGIGQVSFNGVNLGAPIDMYGVADTYLEVAVGSVEVSNTGTQTLAVSVTGKNAASTSYKLALDVLTLEADYND